VSRIIRFFREAWQELQKVNWPTPEQARNLTILVVAISAVVGVYIVIFDYIFGWVAKTLGAG
jgi:preprotein translocase SecE subunit